MSSPANEKSLELDVNADMLIDIRRSNPRAFSIGYTLTYEQMNGLDITIRGVTGRLLSFQYKRPYRSNGNVFWYYFNNNTGNNQHIMLQLSAIAAAGTGSVYYALPAIATVAQLQSISPNFLAYTYFIDPLDVHILDDHRPHRFEADTSHLICHIHSQRAESVPLIPWAKLKQKLERGEAGIDISSFRENLRRVDHRNRSITANSDGSKFMHLRGIIF